MSMSTTAGQVVATSERPPSGGWYVAAGEAARLGLPVIVSPDALRADSSLDISRSGHGEELDRLARRVLRGWREGRGDLRQEIAEEMALAHRMTLEQLHEDCRDPDLVRVRNAIFYEIRLRLGASLPEIGRTMRRDHTTVLHGIRKHAQATGRILPLGISERGAAKMRFLSDCSGIEAGA